MSSFSLFSDRCSTRAVEPRAGATLRSSLATAAFCLTLTPRAADAQPWMNTQLSPDERASLVDNELTFDERISLLHGILATISEGRPAQALAAAGYVPGVPRLGVPALQETDAGLGVTNPQNARPGDGATPLPSSLCTAASFNEQIAYDGGAMIGQEAFRKGFNVLLAGGLNLIREPRNGRNFEYLGEDPLLAGVLGGAIIAGVQSQHVISTAKHFALNDQETHRHWINARIDEEAARESDLLAFQIAIERGAPGSVMCAYNQVNGAYSCGNDWLLNKVLKGDWGYKGWVMSDWGAVRSVDFAREGLDQQSGAELDGDVWFGEPLKQAYLGGQISSARLSDMARRILRSMFAVGLFDDPPVGAPIDYDANAAVSRRAAEEGIVLLENRGLLPAATTARTIVVIGGYADKGVLSGGGSSQVVPAGGPGASVPLGGEGEMASWKTMVFHAPSPLAAIRARAPDAKVLFDDGRYPSAAADLARGADLVVVFGNQWMMESIDAPVLTLPSGQDTLIEAVTAANPRTVVVLQTGGPVFMPWLPAAGAVLEAWYSGARGGEVIADILFGAVNPSGRLPITFPASVLQLPRPVVPGRGLPPEAPAEVIYTEGSDVGYRWFARNGYRPLFPFGYGLSYTSFRYSNLRVAGGDRLSVSFDVTNTGQVEGKDAPQVYLMSAAGRPTQRLIGFAKISLTPGETRSVTMMADPRLLSSFSVGAGGWRGPAGEYRVAVGASSADLRLEGAAQLSAIALEP